MTGLNNKEELRTDKNNNFSLGLGTFFFELVKIFIIALIVIVPIRTFLFQPFFVQGASMEPNFENGQYLIINEFGYKETEISVAGHHFFTVDAFKELKRGDIVVFRYPKNPSQFFIKRIIALPEERIEIKNGKVFVYNSENPKGTELNEDSYLLSQLTTPGEVNVTLADNEYFVMGDNRKASHDSRSWGPVKSGEIIGKVLFRAWPLGEVRVF